MTSINTQWKSWQKISFRFFSLFLGLTSLFCWDLSIFFATSALLKEPYDPTKTYQPLTGFFHWLDQHIYHTGYDPKIHESFPQDNHFGAVFYLTILLFAVIATIAWSLLDRKRSNYNKASYWFNVYLRYILAITMFGYGIDKLIPVQMHYPNAVEMTSRYGEQSLFNVLWHFMGVSPGYMILIGAAELIAALLLLSRRTVVFGCLFMISILANVAAMNWFYNVPVKMFSAQLLFYSLYLAAPYAKNLVEFFFYGASISLERKHYKFEEKRKKISLSTMLVMVPVLFITLLLIGGTKRYKKQEADAHNEKMYDVTSFVAKDTLPPLTTDTLRWNHLALFVYGDNAVVYNMKDKTDWYQFDVDSVKKTYTFHNSPNKDYWPILHYSYPAKGVLQLKGMWKGKDINVSMKLSPIDSIPLNREKIKLIND